MPKSLESLSNQEDKELGQFLLPIMQHYGIQSVSKFGYFVEASEAAIQVLSKQLAINPNRPALLVVFAFLCARQHRYADALFAAERLEKVEPKLLRGAYIQASIYSSLLSASYATKTDTPEYIAQLKAMEQSRMGETGFSMAPLKSLEELKKLGISVYEVAQRGYNLAHQVLQHNLHPYDRKSMLAVAETCRSIYPNVQLFAISQSKSKQSRSWWARLFGDRQSE